MIRFSIHGFIMNDDNAIMDASKNDTTSNDNHHIDNDDSKIEEEEEWIKQRDMYKTQGDEAFRASNYKEAISSYTHAITFDPEYHILYSNRSAAYLSNNERSMALADAKKCVELNPEFVKGHSRLAAAMFSLGRFNEAKKVYERILKEFNSNDSVAIKGIQDCKDREQQLKQNIVRMAQGAGNEVPISSCQEQQQQHDVSTSEQNDKPTSKLETNGNAQVGEQRVNADEEDDELNDFFDEIEEVTTTKSSSNNTDMKTTSLNDTIDRNSKTVQSNKIETEPSLDSHDDPVENQIQIQLSDLGTTQNQIERLLCSNHEWYNLNPFRVLDIAFEAPLSLISRRYKALSLLLHPDKVNSSYPGETSMVDKAGVAFEYVRKAMIMLNDEDKAKHIKSLCEQGRKQGKRDLEKHLTSLQDSKERVEIQNSSRRYKELLGSFQEKATMKIFAEIERKRRDVERRLRTQEMRERAQEDEEVLKGKKEQEFERKWRDKGRVEKRIGNWRDFQKDEGGKKKGRWG